MINASLKIFSRGGFIDTPACSDEIVKDGGDQYMTAVWHYFKPK